MLFTLSMLSVVHVQVVDVVLDAVIVLDVVIVLHIAIVIVVIGVIFGVGGGLDAIIVLDVLVLHITIVIVGGGDVCFGVDESSMETFDVDVVFFVLIFVDDVVASSFFNVSA